MKNIIKILLMSIVLLFSLSANAGHVGVDIVIPLFPMVPYSQPSYANPYSQPYYPPVYVQRPVYEDPYNSVYRRGVEDERHRHEEWNRRHRDDR
jgi:hypothetical protein